jgi:SAM-dependent methyltransferase
MHFQSMNYLLSQRPHAAALRRSLLWAVLYGAKNRVRRLTKGQLGKLGRTSDENREKYDRLAGTYYSAASMDIPKLRVVDGRLTMAPGDVVRQQYCDLIAAIFRAHGVESILEAGAGDGNNLPLLHAHLPKARLHGIDISPKRVEFANGHPLHRELGIEFSVASAAKLPFETGSFDAVYSMYCLEHLPLEFKDAIREMTRVARKCVVLVEPVPEHRGVAQRVYARASEFLRGLPEFLETENFDVESVELLPSAGVPLNMGSLITIRPRHNAASSKSS